jgi:hypothetical protein
VDPRKAPDCTTSRAAPITDVTFAIVSGLTGVTLLLAAAINNGLGDGEDAEKLAVSGLIIGVGGGIGFTASAASGVDKAVECAEVMDRYNAARAPSGPPYQQPYQPYPPYQQPYAVYPPGTERGMCRVPPAPSCDPGLTCASSFCVPLAPQIPQPGTEQGACRLPPGAPCNPGLQCVSNLCLVPPH